MDSSFFFPREEKRLISVRSVKLHSGKDNREEERKKEREKERERENKKSGESNGDETGEEKGKILLVN